MARHTFAGGPSDYVLVTTSGTWRNAGPSTCTVWSAETGGTQVTDLLVDGQAATAVRLGSTGRIPSFEGPDGSEELWLEFPGVPARVRLTRFGAQGPTGPGADVTGAEIEAARDEAQAAKTAAEAARTAAESAAAGAAEAVEGVVPTAEAAARDAVAESLADPEVTEVVSDAVDLRLTGLSVFHVLTATAPVSHATVAATVGGTPVYAGPAKFGSAALSYGNLGVADSVPETQASALTVEKWVRLATGTDTGLRVLWSLGSNLWLGFLNQPRVLRMALNSTTTQVDSTETVTAGEYHHVAVQLTRSGGKNTLAGWWLDGVPISATLGPGTVAWNDDFLLGGLTASSFGIGPYARVDECRVSSVHRYTGTFTPPTAPFTPDDDTLLLFHCENGDAIKRTQGAMTYPPRPAGAPPGTVLYNGSITPTDRVLPDMWAYPKPVV